MSPQSPTGIRWIKESGGGKTREQPRSQPPGRRALTAARPTPKRVHVQGAQGAQGAGRREGRERERAYWKQQLLVLVRFIMTRTQRKIQVATVTINSSNGAVIHLAVLENERHDNSSIFQEQNRLQSWLDGWALHWYLFQQGVVCMMLSESFIHPGTEEKETIPFLNLRALGQRTNRDRHDPQSGSDSAGK
jgi:hypothetical protein